LKEYTWSEKLQASCSHKAISLELNSIAYSWRGEEKLDPIQFSMWKESNFTRRWISQSASLLLYLHDTKNNTFLHNRKIKHRKHRNGTLPHRSLEIMKT